MNGYVVFVLVLFSLSFTGGYLATGKKSQLHEDVGQLLFQASALLLIICLCVPGISLSTYEVLGVSLAILGGFLLGVLIWYDTRDVNSQEKAG